MTKAKSSPYNSFNELLGDIPDLSKSVPGIHKYLAHLPSNDNLGLGDEPLIDHINLVNETTLKLIGIHKLEKIIDNLIDELCKQLDYSQKTHGNFIKELFLASIVFHDYGKLNENFQVKRMQNEKFSKVDLIIGSQHSILSAYFYLNYYLNKLLNIEDNENVILGLGGILLSLSDSILKHHAPQLNIADLDNEKCAQLERFLSFLNIEFQNEHLSFFIEKKRVVQDDIFKVKGCQKTDNYPLYTLIKLNFSLLTAADYLATLSYQNNIKLPDEKDYNWWGILSKDKKDNHYNKFKGSTQYNKSALENPGKLTAIPIDQLQEKSNDNLNHLRSRILGEVILNLRDFNNNKLFYLKAPTGSGKTNISLAAAIELLKLDDSLNKIMYVFPFTTLITQTYSSIKETLGVGNDDIVQLHSKAEWNKKNSEENKDGLYKNEWQNHLDNLFVHYPIVLLSHIRFFDILKSNSKEINYLLHRIANSIIIIDELQSYSPKFWDHVNYFITHYAEAFNIRFILMSATLPEIGKLTLIPKNEWINLIKSPEEYFQNPNFSGRVTFDFTLLGNKLDEENSLNELADFLAKKSELYSTANKEKVKVIIEFIRKSSASDFYAIAADHDVLRNYEILMMTGEILEPRRKEVVDNLKSKKWHDKNQKVLLISTQVVEAGVDIDMDIGFKDTSLIDSDEQLAGRVNRNASKSGNSVYLFNLDNEGKIYQGDERLKIQRKEISLEDYKLILEKKDFNFVYDRIIKNHIENRNQLIKDFDGYLENIKHLRYYKVDSEFRLIEDSTSSIFIPIKIPLYYSNIYSHCSQESEEVKIFSHTERKLMIDLGIIEVGDCEVSGEAVFKTYENAILNRSDDFILDKIKLRKIQSLLSKFTISVYQKTINTLADIEMEWFEQSEPFRYGYLYCSGYEKYYNYLIGFQIPKEFLSKSTHFL